MTASMAKLQLTRIAAWTAVALFMGCGDASADDTSDGGTRDDAACACSPDPASPTTFGIQALDCYCSRPGACLDYATASAVCRPFGSRLDVYPTCNLEVIGFQTNAFEPGVELVYDATTHAIVGASYISDTFRECGERRVSAIRAGTFPPADCARGERKWLCQSDGRHAGAADSAACVAIQLDGEILVGGLSRNGSSTGLGLARLTAGPS